MKRVLVFLSLILLSAALAAAEPVTLDGAVAKALSVNVGYQNSLLAVEKARNAVPDLVNWQGVAVSATRKTSSDPLVDPSTLWGLNLPLFDQLGASATVDDKGNKQVGFTANPLAHSAASETARLAYEKAVVAAGQARVTLQTSVSKAWLAQATAEAQLGWQIKTVALKDNAYQDSKTRLSQGTVTLAEVRTALKDLTDARSAQTTLERALVKARSDLAGLLQSATVELAPWDAAALQAAADKLVSSDAVGDTAAVALQKLEVAAQKAQADAIWWLDPSLAVAANADVPAQGKPTWSASVTVSLSLGSWQGSDRSLADRAVALAQQALDAQVTASKSAQTQALLAVDAARSSVASHTLALAQARELLEETDLLVRTGEATALDQEDAQLGVIAAENDLFQAWADVYGARLDLAVSIS